MKTILTEQHTLNAEIMYREKDNDHSLKHHLQESIGLLHTLSIGCSTRTTAIQALVTTEGLVALYELLGDYLKKKEKI